MNSVPAAGRPFRAALPVAPDPSAQTAPDATGASREADYVGYYYVGECGHRVYGGPFWRVGPCGDCDPSATLIPGRWLSCPLPCSRRPVGPRAGTELVAFRLAVEPLHYRVPNHGRMPFCTGT